ncbi:hypothetical protein [Methanolobus vulcani]|uniref:Membrane domain of glycerophosphoryl diester phosphodiesterase n=1 Tax=Methanolobus vulcani TaxID=38026 RepID=A0A7Z8KQF5_9EURY|nr:hypothetical protein [Methanolobus vulcani]TQD27902.1 hypothetical protein FKV42_02235 [Methanolobus vulcani]
MSWYVIDVIDKAVERTRIFLFEPFDITKWFKLALIVFFIGGSGGFNNGGNAGSYDTSAGEPDISWIPDSFTDFISSLSHHISTFSETTMLIAVVLFLLLIFLVVIIFGYIGSTMEFVLVESLVSNDVRAREYFKKYMGKGLSLYILRMILLLVFILIIAIMSLPFIFLISESNSGPSGILEIIGLFFVSIGIIMVLAIVFGIIGSFINMAIPISMYQDSGLLSAIGSVFSQFKADWKQIIIYWIGRVILGITVAIMAGIIGLIILVILLLILGFIDLALYFILNMILSATVLWSLLISIVIVELLVLSFVSAIIRMPFSVFMKYHMLSFLELWYQIRIPMFDEHYPISVSGSNQSIEEAMVPEE